MRLSDRFRFVRLNMKKNKMRIGMTVLATAMGCAFLIVLASVGFGLHRSVVEQITGGRLLTEITLHGYMNNDGDNRGITLEDVRYLESVKHVKAVTRRQYLPLIVQIAQNGQGSDALDVNVQGVDVASEKKAGFELTEGRLPADGSREIIVGYNLAEMLSGGGQMKDIVGQTVSLKVIVEDANPSLEPSDVTIVGIGKKPSREWQSDQQIYIDYLLFDVMMADEPSMDIDRSATYQVSVFASDVKYVKGIAETIRERGYMNHSVANELDQVNVLFLIMKLGLILVGVIALLIASIGIYNTMTMAVTERSQDIGIMKAIGMHPKTVKNIFLIESSYIGLIGAAIGAIVSYGISGLVNFGLPIVIREFLNEKTPEGLMFSYIPLGLTVLCVGISIVVAIVSGMRPAVRATRIDVLRALRRDI